MYKEQYFLLNKLYIISAACFFFSKLLCHDNTRAALDHSAPPLVVELNVVHLPYPVAEPLAELPRVEGHRLGAVVGLVDPHQPVCQLKHVVTQRDDDELGVLCTLLGGSTAY